jgi:uncharacterized membrane protein YhaH (DUF805 family)
MYWYLEVMKKYAVFAGRARRKEYWMFHLVNFVILLPIMGVAIAGILVQPRTHRPGLFLPFFLIAFGYSLATLIPSLAVSVRRLHDTDLSGWWLLISLVPLGGIVVFVFHVLDGTPGPNRYGPNPKGVTSSSRAIRALPDAGHGSGGCQRNGGAVNHQGLSRVSAQNAEQDWFQEAGFACPAARRQANGFCLSSKLVARN